MQKFFMAVTLVFLLATPALPQVGGPLFTKSGQTCAQRVPSPQTNISLCWYADGGYFQYYNGSAWVRVPPSIVAGTGISVSTGTGTVTISATSVFAPPLDVFGPGFDSQLNVAAFPQANAALLVPFWTGKAVTVTTFRFQTTNSSGNCDVGIYDANGNKVVSSGSFGAPAAGLREQSIASTTLSAGTKYWSALACDNTTETFYRQYGSGWLTYSGIVGSSFPLPASLTLPGKSSPGVGSSGISWPGWSLY